MSKEALIRTKNDLFFFKCKTNLHNFARCLKYKSTYAIKECKLPWLSQEFLNITVMFQKMFPIGNKAYLCRSPENTENTDRNPENTKHIKTL